MTKFAQSLKYYRLAINATQKQMAERLGMTPNAYQKYELGTREPNIDTLIQIADILEVSIDVLVGRTAPENSLMDAK